MRHETTDGRPRDGADVSARAGAEDVPYALYGIPTGVLGAFVVALFFLAMDLVAGRPLATPSALGATLFLERPFDLTAPVRGALVAGYTALHGTVFVAIASLVAVGLFSSRAPREPSFRLCVTVGALAFLACEAVFVAFTLLVGPDVWRVLGFERFTLANALAAVAMGGLFTWLVARKARAPTQEGKPVSDRPGSGGGGSGS